MLYRLLTALALILAASANAQEAVVSPSSPPEVVAESGQSFVPARAIDRPPPAYPESELDHGREAWVELGYCIDESGVPRNIIVLDSAGSPSFEQAAIDAMSQWRFEPATASGKPAWQSNNLQLITFSIDDGVKGGSRRIKKKFRELGQLIDDRKLVEADALFQELIRSDSLNLYELAKIWSQRVRYEALAGDLYTLDLALHRAGASDGRWIEEEQYTQMLGIRARVELQLGNHVDAIAAYRRFAEDAPEDPLVEQMRPAFDKLLELLDSDAILKTPAEVRAKGRCYGCNDSYLFKPIRRKFAFSDIDGELESVDVRCDRRRYEAPVADLVVWQIPESWGSCTVQVHGRPGTTFNLLALPDNWEG